MIDIKEFKGFLKIDRGDLDNEIVQHASLFFEVSEACVEAKAEADTLKEEVATIDAELASKHRIRLEKNGKATDAQVKSAVQQDPKHDKAHCAYIDAKELADKLSALQESFRQRGQMLRELAGLYVTQYFQKSSVSLDDMKNVRHAAQRDRMNDLREKRRRERL